MLHVLDLLENNHILHNYVNTGKTCLDISVEIVMRNMLRGY